ncbi:MAG: hypothetical protein KDC73_00510 [Ignavibacteriae bacterium]|nr:hypothetical protein [Ignavibacteriota bacterium]MCB9243000.1 hypothetical protein [Ignavibacteriales bacterium]
MLPKFNPKTVFPDSEKDAYKDINIDGLLRLRKKYKLKRLLYQFLIALVIIVPIAYAIIMNIYFKRSFIADIGRAFLALVVLLVAFASGATKYKTEQIKINEELTKKGYID